MTSSQRLALVNAHLVDPAADHVAIGGVLIESGVISAAGPSVTGPNAGAEAHVIDCRGLHVSPGLIDMRAFIGEPGASHRETIATVSAAAAAGGVTTILATPDTNPPADGSATVDYIRRRARDNARVRILVCAALTKGLAGAEIAEIGLLQQAGAVAFSNGAQCVQSAQVMRRAMTYARDFDALVMHRAEDRDMARAGVMNEGEFAARLGLAGIPAEAEVIVLERDLRLAALTGARLHCELVTTPQSLDAISRARHEGVAVTCGASINHLTLNENDVGDYRTFLKISPPLRSEDVRLKLVEGLRDGVIDVIVSDHNPQDVETKRVPFGEAAYGAIGVETMLAAGLRLVHAGQISLPKLLAAMTLRPAEILRLPQGRLVAGAPADIIAFDPDEPFIVDPAALHSRCRNTPFDEARLQGRVKLTIVEGEIVLDQREPIPA